MSKGTTAHLERSFSYFYGYVEQEQKIILGEHGIGIERLCIKI
jgi:hypothetical protein